MKDRRGLWLVAVVAAAGLGAAAGLIGCGDRPAPSAPVRGRVTCAGHPLAGATVVFAPDASKGGRGELAHATAGPDGYYVLQGKGGPGAAAGWHRVTVAALAGPVRPADRYRHPELSGLAAEVKPGADNVFDYDLDPAAEP